MTTVAELAKAWHAELDRRAGADDIGDLTSIDRQLIETPIETPADLAALLGVVMRDFQMHHEDLAGNLSFHDNGEELAWTAIKAAHRMLTRA